jgi:predicted kinase
MHKIILCMGISGSGKTTWAKEWVAEQPDKRIRLNYDDIRSMFGVYWVPGKREQLMKDTFIYSLSQAMYMGYDIVIDNMSNLNPKHQEEYKEYIEKHNAFNEGNEYELEYKWFDTPVEVCIERDSRREIKIGETVIKQQWKKYRTSIIQHSIKEMLDNQVVQDNKLPHCIIVDMDATLCFNTSGRPFYGPGTADQIINDIPNISIIDLVKAYYREYDCDLVVITGRDESCREATREWLDKYHLSPKMLLMRKMGDCSKGEECKKKLYEENIKGKYNVDLVFEDSSKVVKMYRELGLTVLQPNEGKF